MKINSTNMINIGDVAYWLLNRRTMMPRFRLPLTKEDVFTLLVSAVQGEVESRYRTFIPNENLTEQLQKMAAWLTNKDSKFGMLLCGGCGNGKTTIVKAFQ